MSYTLANAARDAAVDAIVDLIDVGTTNAQGALQFRDAAQLIASLDLNNPAFNASSSGSSALDTTGTIQGTVTPAGASTIDRFRLVDRDVTTIFDGAAGSVAVSGADINLSSVVVNQNDVIEITGLTVTIPATGGA